MWGNWIGWLISLVMAAAIAGGITYIDRLDRPAGTTSFVSDLGKFRIAFNPHPRELVPADKPGDADAILRRAIERYEADPIEYIRFNRGETDSAAGTLNAISLLVEATHLIDNGVFAGRPSRVVTFDRPLSEVQALLAVGKATIRAGFLKRRDDTKAAEAHYRAAFSLGARLFEERLAWDEFNTGVTLLAESGAALEQLHGATGAVANAERFKSFNADRIAATQRFREIRTAISAPDPRGLHAGDALYLAASDVERLWRIESIFAAGRFQKNAARIGDATAARRLLVKLADSDPDPLIKLAVTAARDMTDAQYQTSFQMVE